jgi:hypothetical protein
MKSLVAAGLLTLALSSAATAQERIVTIVNQTSYDIVDFYAANRDDRNWGGTFLPGRDYLAPGYELDVNIDDGSGYCLFDFLAVFEDGVETRKNNVNACELDVFYFTEN